MFAFDASALLSVFPCARKYVWLCARTCTGNAMLFVNSIIQCSVEHTMELRFWRQSRIRHVISGGRGGGTEAGKLSVMTGGIYDDRGATF